VRRWSSEAYEDLFEIFDFIKQDKSEAARKLASAILTKVSRLRRSPHVGPVVPELLEQGVSMYRQVIAGNYRVIYEADPQVITVHLVIDSRRNLSDVLIQRLLR
jgi:plasmid stabilization system protein ParE